MILQRVLANTSAECSRPWLNNAQLRNRHGHLSAMLPQECPHNGSGSADGQRFRAVSRFTIRFVNA